MTAVATHLVEQTARCAALVSIHPEFAERILAGEKQVEFRRRPFRSRVTHIVIYATSPVCAVVGIAEVHKAELGTPSTLWDRFGAVGGIERQRFFGYFTGTAVGVAYLLAGTRRCEPSCPLGQFGLPKRPPQAFQYLDTRTLDAVLVASIGGF